VAIAGERGAGVDSGTGGAAGGEAGAGGGLAYFLFALIITIPLGVKIINRIPYLIALREPPVLATLWGTVAVQQHSLLIRAIWFILIGFWLAAFWMSLAYALCLTIIGMPLGFWMFDKTPAILTLRKSA